MASTTTSLINHNFGGISRKDSSFSSDLITCSDCQNVELYYTGLNSGVGIRTSRGNQAITKYTKGGEIINLIPSDENVIEIFDSEMGGESQFVVYTENETEGKLYILNTVAGTLDKYIDGLSVTGNACGCDFAESWLDIFCFSNGTDIRYLYYNQEEATKGIQVMDMSTCTLEDSDGRTVHGLGMVSFDSRLWIFNDKVLWYSEQANCKNFKGSASGEGVITEAGYMEFVKNVTAIYPYLGSLAVFHKDSSQLVTVDSTTGFKQEDESPGGCASYKSLVFHGTDLYFYDDTKKGVFSFQQVVNGDKTLGNNIAYDIQEELMDIDDVSKIRALSVVTSDRNEIWFLTPIEATYEVTSGEEIIEKTASIILIYDYIRGGWVKRKCQEIHCINVVNGKLYSGGKDIYLEYTSNYFNGDFIPCYYTCTIFNFDADNTLKITKFPPRITASSTYNCKFWVRYIKNYNKKKIKEKYVSAKYTSNTPKWNDGTTWNSGAEWKLETSNFIVKCPSATFKALEITFYTTKATEEFCFRDIEFSKIKVKQI